MLVSAYAVLNSKPGWQKVSVKLSHEAINTFNTYWRVLK